MRSEWRPKRLGDVATLKRGFDLPTRERVNGQFPLVSSSGIIDTHNEGPIKAPGVATGRSGSIGNVFYVEEDFWPLNTVLFVTDFHGNDPKFVFHLLRKFDLNRFASGAGVPTLNRNFVHDEIVSIPSVAEQRRIVDILDEAFDGIATAKTHTEQNLQNARAVFESYRNALFARGGEGWSERYLRDIAKTQYGLSKAMNEEGKGFKIFRMGEVQDGRLLDSGRMKFVDIKESEFEKYKLKPGDVLFNRTNSFELVGKTGIFELSGEYCFASYLVRLILKSTEISPELLNYLMNSAKFQASVKQKASRSINQANINATILGNELIQFPESLNEQQAIVDHLNSLREESQRLESIYTRKLAALDELKQSLLHEAFAGNL